MAQVEIGAKVTVEAGNASARVLELQQSVKKLNEEFKNSKQGTEEQKQAFLNLQKAQNDLKKANKELGSSLNETSGEAKSSGGHFSKLKDSMSAVSPAAGGAAEGAGKFNAALNVLKANPIIAILAILTAIIIALINKFKDMDAASDKMSDAWGELSGIFESFMNAILTPLIDGFVALIDLFVKAAEWLGDKLGVSSKEASQNLGRLAKANRELDESQKAQAESLAASNRKLQEAREIAGDANVPIKERIQALKDAAKEEKKQLDDVAEWNRQKLAVQLEQFAQEMGARDQVIGKIKEGTIESLKAAKAELLSMKNVNEDKVQELSKYIIEAENAAAQSAKIGKKTSSQIASLEKEEADKLEQQRKEASDRAAAKKKERDDKIRQKNENDRQYELRMEKLKQAEILDAIDNQYAKERKMAEFKMKDDIRQAEEDLKNGKLTNAQKIALVEQYEKDKFRKINEINAKQEADNIKKQADIDAAEKAAAEKKKKEEEAAALKKKKEEEAAAKKKIDDLRAKADDENLNFNQKRAILDQERALNQEYYNKGLIDQETFLKNSQDIDKADTEIKKSENEAKKQLLDSYLGALDGVANVIGKQTTAGKAISVASALISTYEGIAKGVKLGYPMAIPAVISAATTGFAAVKNILAVKVPNGGGGGGSTPVTPNLGSSPLVPREQTTTTSLTGRTLASMNATASRAYVVESDITSGQQRMERINRAARLA
jgi:aspartate beta-hydroxylase